MTTTRGPDTVSGVITNWLPFTTPGPGQSLAQCSTAIYYLPGAVSGFVAFDPYYGRWIDTAVKCLATEQTRWWEQHSDGITTNINLGPFACPTGYTTATISSVNPLTSFVGCCPSSYTFLGSFLGAATLGQCHSPLKVGQTIVAKSTIDTNFNWKDTTAVVIGNGFSVAAVHVNGFVFREKALTTPASTSVSTTQPGTSSTTSSVQPLNTSIQSIVPVETAPVTSEGLSNGAKIGIGVGISLGVLGTVCLAAAIFILKRRTRAPQSPRYPSGFAEAPSYPANYPMAKRAQGGSSIYEAQRGTIHEAPDGMRHQSKGPAEMWVAPHQGG
ncbi:hypothetical protein ONS95_004146 [Cadophora gregata]|uniref:uncharacterized protein n=1 Tax=Cadophora gregata TaxID=51156 RepID=UPI0026DC46E4|nr:uncharacterized protein ONS95_004146 [Cadophora gregata]KAK0105492.1 hypothetical protein ONS96_004877 [Cadophora gregata f. sp. sojae]KAK0105616.1 hypothetical protein ONS95_004146 [Cadophora gregata]